ncbi:unnamed protein product [Leptosia nina]|uniref:Uncharacterized protein n=1 Tax=Leptosia nina TaxID=320188 RepID=A0AAV1IZ82_9NEOP
MIVILLGLYSLIPFIHCGDKVKNGMTEVMGIETGNDIKIDKNTIITQNMKLTTRNYKKEKQEQEPDWSYSSIPIDVSEHAQEFKRNMTECLKEVQAAKPQIRRLSPKMESPVHGECLIACVLKRNGVIERGKIHKENLILLIKKFYPKEDKLIKKLERNINKCINMSVKNKDECALAEQLNQCTHNIMMNNNKHKIVENKKN